MSLILNFSADGWVVVRIHREGDGFDTGEECEDSDCESSSEQTSESVLKVKDDSKGELKPESLPLLSVGSFSRYAYHRWQARFLTL